ncbi:MAG: hypothetical protein SGJ02_04450 [bacterium]|nr:hypothetical protein [bacterium]
MITRIVFSAVFWTILGQWGYAELKILCPAFVPAVDYTLQHVQIPTHDKWSKEKLTDLLAGVSDKFKDSKIF